MNTDNQIIAEFIGLMVFKSFEELNRVPIEKLTEWVYADECRYNESWDSLMPVIQKIEGVLSTPDVKILIGWEHWNNQFDGEINTDINVAYSIVVEFIKWYNEKL